MEDAYRTTQAKVQSLRDRGYTVVEMWECDWHQRLQDQPEVADCMSSLHLQPPLQPCEVFFGGCTNVVQLHHTAAQGEEIHYYDYTSLYPWVKNPLGHPEFIYTPNTVDLHPYFGLAKCSVLPPLGLYHPVLPYCTGDKLTFPLCRICVEDQLDLPLHAKTWHCPHTPEQRALTGTWCTPELEKAVEQGYVVQKIHEVWHFPQSHKGLFAKYVNTWLQIKEEASRVYHPGKPSPTHPQLCATGRHPLGLRPHRLQSQTMHLGQDDAELHVGKIWPMRQQDASPRIH